MSPRDLNRAIRESSPSVMHDTPAPSLGQPISMDRAGGAASSCSALAGSSEPGDPVAYPGQDAACDPVFDPDFDLSPLIKAELRTTIRNRRLNSGKSDDLTYEDPPKPQYKLTEEEEEKRQLRRDRNRIAAAKCRVKRRQETHGLSLESEHLQSTNDNLRAEIEKLQSEKRTLLELINSHRPSCIMRTSVGPSDDAAQNAQKAHSVR